MLQPIKVTGFACPYNVANCYDEAMKPGAFDAFIKEQWGRPLLMKADHQLEIGVWDRLWTTHEGLWCEGRIITPAGHGYFNEVGRYSPELSICFNNCVGPHCPMPAYTNARVQMLGRKPPFARVVPAIAESKVGLSEISLCESGAFRGTFYRRVP